MLSRVVEGARLARPRLDHGRHLQLSVESTSSVVCDLVEIYVWVELSRVVLGARLRRLKGFIDKTTPIDSRQEYSAKALFGSRTRTSRSEGGLEHRFPIRDEPLLLHKNS